MFYRANPVAIEAVPRSYCKESFALTDWKWVVVLARVLIAIALPAWAFLQADLRRPFCWNIPLAPLGYISGLAHALWVTAKR